MDTPRRRQPPERPPAPPPPDDPPARRAGPPLASIPVFAGIALVAVFVVIGVAVATGTADQLPWGAIAGVVLILAVMVVTARRRARSIRDAFPDDEG